MIPKNILKPTLLLDEEKCQANIDNMFNKARKHNLRLRPHFKTHQSATIGQWFKNCGLHSITVSSVDMAIYFANNGWTDITIAFTLNIRELDKINSLAKRINLNLLVSSDDPIIHLKKEIANRIGLYIEIDTGYHRTGILPHNKQEITKILTHIEDSSNIEFNGFLTHSGHSYNADSRQEISEIHFDSLDKMNSLKESYKNHFPNLELSIGDTPCCSIMDNFEGIDEIRPGNFVFYDVMQYQLGSCSHEQIAVAVACPVVTKHKERYEIVIYGGAIHFSKEYILSNNIKQFGLVCELGENGWSAPIKDNYVSSLSQEHGILKCTKRFFKKIETGDLIVVLPIHSCLTSNLMPGYLTLKNEYF